MSVIEKWEQMQTKTFTKWVNMHLGKRSKQIGTVLTDLSDGTNLINLLEIIGEANLGKFNANPKMRLQKIENVNKALQFIKDRGVQLASIGAEDIVDTNPKLTLGMVWTIILRFAISELSEEGLSAKQGLLLWCQKKTQGYKDVSVKDFQDSFADGLAFCALIHRHRPDLLDYNTLAKENQRDNLNLAFDLAEKHLGVPKLLDTEDIVSMPKPDERSIMTYCAALYKVFSTYDKVEIAGKRVAKFLAFMKAAQEMIHDYEERARALRTSIEAKQAELEQSTTALSTDFQGVKDQIAGFRNYKKTEKVALNSEQSDLSVLLSNIQIKMKSMGKPAYVPPAGLDTAALEEVMDQLTATERKVWSALNAQMRSVLDNLRHAFADPANNCFEMLTKFKAVLASESDPAALEASLTEMQNTLPAQLETTATAEQACEAANILENQWSDHTTDDLRGFYAQLVKSYGKKIAFLKAQAEEAQGGSASAESKMAEFKESFDYFDKDHNGYLTLLEFQACLASLGLITVDFTGKDKTAEKIFMQVTAGGQNMTFDMYAQYMATLVQDTFDPKQLQESFQSIAGGKKFVTKDDLTRAQIPEDQAEFVTKTLPPLNEGYDFSAFCQ